MSLPFVSIFTSSKNLRIISAKTPIHPPANIILVQLKKKMNTIHSARIVCYLVCVEDYKKCDADAVDS